MKNELKNELENQKTVFTFVSLERDIVSILENGLMTIKTDRKLPQDKINNLCKRAFEKLEKNAPEKYKRIVEMHTINK